MLHHPTYYRYYIDTEVNIQGPKGKINPTKHHTGYLVFSVSNNKQVRAHRFIYECYYGLLDYNLQINHIDGDKINNSINNLEAITPKENIQHAYKLGLRKKYQGEDAPRAKLSNIEATELIKDILEGKSNNYIGSKYNLHPRYVSLIRHRRRWKKLWQEIEGSETISQESRTK